MASVGKGKGNVFCNSWARHLRPEGKRLFNKSARKAGKEEARRQEHECMEWWWYPDPYDVMDRETEEEYWEMENYDWWRENNDL